MAAQPEIRRECDCCHRVLGSEGMSRDVGGYCWGCVGEISYNHCTGEERLRREVRREITQGLRDRNGVPL
jgi:hypothetical protein